MIKKKRIKANRKKLLLGNNTSKKGYKTIIDKLVELQLQGNNKLIIVSVDKVCVNIIIKTWLKRKPNFKKAIYVRNNTELLEKIKFVVFNQSLQITAPIIILDKILIIIPGYLPKQLHYEEIEKKLLERKKPC